MGRQCFLFLKAAKSYSKPFFSFINCNKIMQTMEYQNNTECTEGSKGFYVRKQKPEYCQ